MDTKAALEAMDAWKDGCDQDTRIGSSTLSITIFSMLLAPSAPSHTARHAYHAVLSACVVMGVYTVYHKPGRTQGQLVPAQVGEVCRT